MAQGGRLSALLAAAALVLAACGGGGGGQQGGATPTPAAGGSTVAVEETEFKFTPNTLTAKAGSITINIKNVGSVEHNFVIEKTPVNEEAIQPGQTDTVTVTLSPGTYSVLCTVPGHREAGMTATLTVTP